MSQRLGRRRVREPYAAALVLLAGLLVGCASPGVPRPPSLHLPAPVRDLTAVRSGGNAVLRFTAPEQTTDRLELTRKGVPVPLTAVVCRVQAAACLPVARLATAPGQVVTTADLLPPALTIGPGRPVAYRVRVENASGRDAGNSADALVAAGAAPAPIASLAASTVAGGIQITWQASPGEHDTVRVEAVTESAGSAGPANGGAAKKSAPGQSQRSSGAERLLQIRAEPRDPGGAIDPALPAGARVRYTVYRERDVMVNGVALPMQGASATVTVVRSADVFAPAAPTGLLALSVFTEGSGPEVSLSWEPGGEPDVAGYNVYRATGGGPFARVSPAAVPGVSFSDTVKTGLASGMHVRYAVTAVDRHGNESARSAPAEADVH